MRILMLGWEFPPFISGGLGTACYGLTKALSKQKDEVLFVLPKSIGTDYHRTHVKLLSPQSPAAAAGDRSASSVASTYQLKTPQTQSGSATPARPDDRHTEPPVDADAPPSPGQASDASGLPTSSASFDATPEHEAPEGFEGVTFKAVPSRLISPYQSAGEAGQPAPAPLPPGVFEPIRVLNAPAPQAPKRATPPQTQTQAGAPGDPSPPQADAQPTAQPYAGDLIVEAQRYADLCVDLALGETFDVIHAHDWMTFPAGMAIAAATGKPLVVHVHSTEFDRSGDNINPRVFDIERRGTHAALRVIAVSHLTRSILEHRYDVDPERIDVVYNGIESPAADVVRNPQARIRKGDRIVLFLGRVTMQKGPEYFIQAARKVLNKVDDVKFVVAGSGDRIYEIIELAAREGIGHRVLFTGFLRGDDVERIFKMASVYVMPSVSEPFGIAPLEAISHDVPVIISKTSGVSEVLTHALKVDFWDTDDIADKIIAVLRHPPLSAALRNQADIELRSLTWDGAARSVREAYDRAIELMPV